MPNPTSPAAAEGWDAFQLISREASGTERGPYLIQITSPEGKVWQMFMPENQWKDTARRWEIIRIGYELNPERRTHA
jgi:hypothetical protein